jgi:glycosyltransferase involved in cell wall biosynthesis
LAGKDIRVVPNSVELPPRVSSEERRAIRTELAGNPDDPLVITVGRLTPQKGYKDLLAAFSRVARDFPHTRLLIVGQGRLHAELQRRIAELGLEQQVQMLGLRTDVPHLLAASDIYVNSSLWEGLSEAMLEAMAAGLPVVATAVGDAPWVVVDGAGCLAPPGQPERLAEALSELLADPERRHRFGAAARQYALCNHDPSAWAGRILDIYEDRPGSTSQPLHGVAP